MLNDAELHLFACTEDNPREITTRLVVAKDKETALREFMNKYGDILRGWGSYYAEQIDEVDGYQIVLVSKTQV